MKTIGQFAKDNNVTVKTLHHYEKMELINPCVVDADTGYRYYGKDESLQLKIILFFKDLGLSLSEINDVINDRFTIDTFTDFMMFKKYQTNKDIEHASNRLNRLNSIINMLESNESKKIDYKELLNMGEEKLYSGKYGRGTFIEESTKLFKKSRHDKTPFSVIELDLDLFHKLNQKYGYDVGDIVLERTQNEIISILQDCEYKSLLERKGGDEFSITVLANTINASILATKILNGVSKVDYSDVAEKLKVYITAGISGLTNSTDSYSQLVHEATIQLIETKKKNRS